MATKKRVLQEARTFAGKDAARALQESEVAMYLLAVLIAKLLDPIVILLALVAGGLSQKWWQVIVGASVVAVIGELFLFSIQIGRTFNPVTFFLGIVAAAVWASMAFAIMCYKAQRKLQDL
jgi:hypothetical protein